VQTEIFIMILQAFLAAFSIQGIHGFPMAKPAWGELAALKSLHSDAVKASSGDNLWFSAIDAKTLDRLIIEMNEMNRWFAKVVKYWDDFSAGGNGEQVLKENGRGLSDSSTASKNDSLKGGAAFAESSEETQTLKEKELSSSAENIKNGKKEMYSDDGKLTGKQAENDDLYDSEAEDVGKSEIDDYRMLKGGMENKEEQKDGAQKGKLEEEENFEEYDEDVNEKVEKTKIQGNDDENKKKKFSLKKKERFNEDEDEDENEEESNDADEKEYEDEDSKDDGGDNEAVEEEEGSGKNVQSKNNLKSIARRWRF